MLFYNRFDRFAQRTSRRRELDGETDSAITHGQILDHSETDDIAMQFGILNFAERGENIFLIYRDPFFPFDAKEH